MPISEVASLIGGAVLGAPFSEILAMVIAEAKKVKDFKPLSQDLASTMERLVPILEEIELAQEGWNPDKGELKVLTRTIERADEMVRKCSDVQKYNIFKKSLYTRQIKRINQDFLRFCQIELQLIQHKNLLKSMRSMSMVTKKIDILSDTGKELFVVPQPEMVRNCSRVQWYGLVNEDFVKFCQHRNQLESPLRLQETSNISTRASLDEDEIVKEVSLREAEAKTEEQLASAIQESSPLSQREEEEERSLTALKQDISLREAEELASAIQDSSLRCQREEEEERMRTRALKEKISLREAEELASAIQDSSLRCQREEEEERMRTRALKEKISLREAEELASAIQDSSLRCQREEEEERMRTRALKEKISLREAEELASAIQESYLLRQREEKVAKRRARELEKDEQIANGLLEDERERITNGSSSSTRAHEDEQRIIWGILKEKGKGKQVKVDEDEIVKEISMREAKAKDDEQLASAIQESSCLRQQEKEDERKHNRALEKEISLREAEELASAIQESFLCRQQGVAELEKYELIANGLLYDEIERLLDNKEDLQLVNTVKESLIEEGKRKQFEEQAKKNEQLALIFQESLNIVENENIPIRAPLDEGEVEENGKLPEVNPHLSSEIEHGRSVNVSGVLSNSGGKFHKSCYVCKKKKHEQLAQDLQNFFSKIADEESSLLRDNSVFNEQFTKTFKKSLKEKGKPQIRCKKMKSSQR